MIGTKLLLGGTFLPPSRASRHQSATIALRNSDDFTGAPLSVRRQTLRKKVRRSGVALDGDGTTVVTPSPTAPTAISSQPPAPPQPAVLTPKATYDKFVALGVAKAGMPAGQAFVSAVQAGVCIALGCLLMLCVGGACPGLAATNAGLHKFVLGSVGLPSGTLLCLMTGGELFTSNGAILGTALYEGRIPPAALLRNLAIVYAGNLVGAVLLALLATASGVLAGATGPATVAAAKCAPPASQVFVRGIICNYLVCLAVWLATAANDLGGKFIGVLLPISAFVTMSMENVVANFFLLAFGMLSGAAVTARQAIISNIIPATLGNALAGVMGVGLLLSYSFGSLGTPKTASKLAPIV